MDEVIPVSQYEQAHPLPELGHIVLSNEAFYGITLNQKNNANECINAMPVPPSTVCEVVDEPSFCICSSVVHSTNQTIELTRFENLPTPILPADKTLVCSNCSSTTQPCDNAQGGSNCREATDSTAEAEFLYQLNLSKRDKVMTRVPAGKNRPNTRSNLRRKRNLKATKQCSLKASAKCAVGKTKGKSKKVTFKEKIMRIKASSQRQQTALNAIKESQRFNASAKPAVSKTRQNCTLSKESEIDDFVSGLCRLCHWAYSSKEERAKHFADPKHIVNAEVKKGTDYQSLKEEARVFGDVKLPASCSICNETSSKRREFLAHHRRHAGMQPYHCIRCKSKFYRRCDLLKHLRDHIGGNAKFKCRECSSAFSRKERLTTHLIIKHGYTDCRPRNFKCTECKKAFKTKHEVNMHMRTHTGYCAFSCSICGKGFSNQFNLRTHQRVHSGETPFKCDQCNYAARSKQLLQRHRLSHNGEKPCKCQLCTYTCSTLQGLKRHMLKHSGSKPFKCPYCEYRSSNIENLRKHIKKTRKHIGLNIYPCQNCSFSTDDGAEYVRHVKQQHYPYLDEDNTSATKLSGIFVAEVEQHSNQAVVVTPLSANGQALPGTTLPSVNTVLNQLPEVSTIDMVMVNDTGSYISSATGSENNKSDFLNPETVSCLPTLPADMVGDFSVPHHTNEIDAVQQAPVNGIGETFYALIKIPLQQVIIPPVDGTSPVTLVIGSDQSPPDGVEDVNQLPAVTDDGRSKVVTSVNPTTQSSFTEDAFSNSNGHQRYIISSAGISSYKKVS